MGKFLIGILVGVGSTIAGLRLLGIPVDELLRRAVDERRQSEKQRETHETHSTDDVRAEQDEGAHRS